MNDLTVLTDAEIDSKINSIDKRKADLQTSQGQGFLMSKMRECIGWLQTIGYKFEGDESVLARMWADSLKDEFARIGEAGIKNAVMKWASEDNSEYRVFPKVAWIKETCEGMGENPWVEKGKRALKEAERQMEEEHQKEIDEIKKDPVRWAEIQKKAEKLRERYASFEGNNTERKN